MYLHSQRDVYCWGLTDLKLREALVSNFSLSLLFFEIKNAIQCIILHVYSCLSFKFLGNYICTLIPLSALLKKCRNKNRS